jgi:hypothetical protein
VDVISHDLVNVDRSIDFGGNTIDDLDQAGIRVIGQDRSAVFGAPEKAGLERENSAGVFCIACPHRIYILQAGN